jgi:hypothetical protein
LVAAALFAATAGEAIADFFAGHYASWPGDADTIAYAEDMETYGPRCG